MKVARAVEQLVAFGHDNGLGFIERKEPVFAMLGEFFADQELAELDPPALEAFCLDAGFDPELADAWFAAKRSAWSSTYDGDDYLRKWGARIPCDALVRYYNECATTPRRALDLGCGDGVNAIFMASRGTRVDALDLAPGAIDLLERHARANGCDVHGHVGSAHALPTELGEYDLVFDRGCFHHVPVVFWHLYKQQVHSHLASDGRLLLLCHTPKVFAERYSDLFLGCFGRLVRFLCDGQAESSFSPGDLAKIFADKFEILDQRRAPDHEGKSFEFNVCTMKKAQR